MIKYTPAFDEFTPAFRQNTPAFWEKPTRIGNRTPEKRFRFSLVLFSVPVARPYKDSAWAAIIKPITSE